MSRTPTRLTDLRGLSRLGIDAVTGVTDVVEAMHRNIAGLAPPLGRGREGPTTGLTGLIYRSVRGVTRGVGAALDGALGLAAPWLDQPLTGPARDALVAALNGSHGDHLADSGNPLAIPMQLRRNGQPVLDRLGTLADLGPRPLVLIHGLCMTDHQWQRNGHDHGAALARDLGYTPLYLHYNTGRSVQQNGAELADQLEALLAVWPVPLTSLTLLGHSMGGLVARAACFHAAQRGLGWRDRCHALVTLGTPHHGAPAERAGAGLDWLLGLSPYSAPIARLGKSRSLGIRDLRSGRCAPPRTPAAHTLPPRTLLIAGTRSESIDAPLLSGDGLVPVASALGAHVDPARALPVSERQVWAGLGHFDLLDAAQVYACVRDWLRLQGAEAGASSAAAQDH